MLFLLQLSAFAWIGHMHHKGTREMKLRAHEEPVHHDIASKKRDARMQEHKTAQHESRVVKPKFVQKSMTSPPAKSIRAEDFTPLGPGKCVYHKGEHISSTDYFFALSNDSAACNEACKNNADCKAFYADEYGCFSFRNDYKQVRSPTIGTIEKTRPYCWVKSPTYAVPFPFERLYSARLEFHGCIEVAGSPVSHSFDIIDMSGVVGTGVNMANWERCGVACAPYLNGLFFLRIDKCFCGDARQMGSTVANSECGEPVSPEENFVPPRYPGAFGNNATNFYAQYRVPYVKLNEDCPDGGRNLPSRYIKSGDFRPSSAVQSLGDPAKGGWEQVAIDPTSGDGCLDLCARLCTDRGTSCHGYSCATPKSTPGYAWFTELNEDSWDGHDSNCFLAMKAFPIPPVRPPMYTVGFTWEPSHVVCARRHCLDETVCSTADFHRVSGFVYPDSADLIAVSTSIGNDTCASCAVECQKISTCYMYQCSEGIAAAFGTGNTRNCLFFSSYNPEGVTPFNVSDVALCRRLASKECAVADGYTAVGEESCACGTQTCLGSSHNVSMTCYIDATYPTGVCLQMENGCPEGEIRSNSTGTNCTCTNKVECDLDPECGEATVAECPLAASRAAILTAACKATNGTCGDTPLADHCVECGDVNVTVPSKCAAECEALELTSSCNGTVVITSGACGFPNNCSSTPCPDDCTADSIVCGSDGNEYASLCDVTHTINVTYVGDGVCTKNCSTVADSDCICGGGGATPGEECDAKSAAYCSEPGPNGKCVEVCDGDVSNHTDCICASGVGTENVAYSYCTGSNTESGTVNTYCPPKTTSTGITTSTTTMTTMAPTAGGISITPCIHDPGCAADCSTLSPDDQTTTSCLCGASFCCKNEMCAQKSADEETCVKICEMAGETECACTPPTGNSTLLECGPDEGAWAPSWDGTAIVGGLGGCTCVKKCTVYGEGGCLCPKPDGDVEECTGDSLCTAEIGGTGYCVVKCTEFGQTDCVCGDYTNGTANTIQLCNSTAENPTYCTAVGDTATILDPDNTLTVEKHVCVPICSDGGGDCFCTSGPITNTTPICETTVGQSSFCNLTDPASTVCNPGCNDTQASTALLESCQCGHDAAGEPLVCEAGEYCAALTTSGDTQAAQCSPTKPVLCGNLTTTQNLFSLVGLTSSNDMCVCSVDTGDRLRICTQNTYCLAETGNCLVSKIRACASGTVIPEVPCYCCNADDYLVRPGGICQVGNLCQYPGQCKCAVPTRVCYGTMIEKCVCGFDSKFCGVGWKCVFDPSQAHPNSTQCSGGVGGIDSCSLARYGHCVPI